MRVAPSRRALRLAALVAGLGAGLGGSHAAAAPSVPPAGARLSGQFAIAGQVTVASDIPGERVGQTVNRSWSFQSQCDVPQCPTATLIRARASATDTLTLRLQSPAYYVGSGSFYAAVGCGGRVYPRGALVPFTIAVRITAAAPLGSQDVTTSIRATYINRSRTNLTPCVSALGHDSARYQGTVTAAA